MPSRAMPEGSGTGSEPPSDDPPPKPLRVPELPEPPLAGLPDSLDPPSKLLEPWGEDGPPKNVPLKIGPRPKRPSPGRAEDPPGNDPKPNGSIPPMFEPRPPEPPPAEPNPVFPLVPRPIGLVTPANPWPTAERVPKTFCKLPGIDRETPDRTNSVSHDATLRTPTPANRPFAALPLFKTGIVRPQFSPTINEAWAVSCLPSQMVVVNSPKNAGRKRTIRVVISCLKWNQGGSNGGRVGAVLRRDHIWRFGDSTVVRSRHRCEL